MRGFAGKPTRTVSSGSALPAPDQLIADLEKRTFDYFWETTNSANGLVPDRWPSPTFASITAVGFGLTAYPIGVERGYVTREQAGERVLATVRFFWRAPQGPQESGTTGYNGFFYHFLDMETGLNIPSYELSTMDTALLLAGMLFCRAYFNHSNPVETEIRALIDKIEARIDWTWAQPRAPAICHDWTPEDGFSSGDWTGYSEAMLLYILALGSPRNAVAPEAWAAWCSTYNEDWGTLYGQEHLTFWCLFGHQFSHAWIDFRGIRDAYMRRQGLDYFENTRRAIYAQRAYAQINPMRWKGYGANVWGMTGCDGPADVQVPQAYGERKFSSYAARGIGIPFSFDDGTIAPSAAIASIPFAPEITVPVVQQICATYGELTYGKYGFLDAFNPSFDYDVPLVNGRRVPGAGWVDIDYLGTNLGLSIAMIENYRSDLVWRTVRRDPTIRRGLERAGFSGGWLEGAL